jgi:hypothetical protein
MDSNKTTDRWSMISALGGTLLILVTVSFVAYQLERIENYAVKVYESGVLVELELESLEKELLAIESVLREADSVGESEQPVEVAGIAYERQQIEFFRQEAENYRDLIQAKKETLGSVERSKQGLLTDLLILFWASLFVLLVGIILAILGYLSWFQKLKVFPDRRRGPRADDLEAFRQ